MTTVTLAAATGVNRFIAASGAVYYVDASGNITIPSDDVPAALQAGFLTPASGNLDGATIEDSTIGADAADTIGFYGATKIAQPASASQAAFTPSTLTAIAATVFSTAAAGVWGFSSSTVAKSYRTQVNKLIVDLPKVETLLIQMRADIVELGLLKGAA
jgi:hypothetical protein